jgi:hypothetical protein
VMDVSRNGVEYQADPFHEGYDTCFVWLCQAVEVADFKTRGCPQCS